MKTVIFFLVFVVLVPLSCEENSLLGIRIYYNDLKVFSRLNGKTHTIHIIAALVCFTLFLLHMIIAFVKWRKKLIYLHRRRYGGFNYYNRNFPVSNTGRTTPLKLSGGHLTPITVTRETLIGLNYGTFKMLIWFILHDQLRVNLRILRLFPINRRAPVYTVEQILEGKTEEFRALQRFIFKGRAVGGRYGKQNCPPRNIEGATVIAAISGDEVHISQNERCEEIFHEPCPVLPHKGMEIQEETASNGHGDDRASGYEPANVIRKALTAIFSKVKKDVDETYVVKDLPDEAGSKKMDCSEALECDGNGKEEKTPLTKDCLKERFEREKSKVVNVSEPKERVEDMTEMIKLMFGSCAGRRDFDGDEGFLDQKIKKATEMKSKPLIFHEDTMLKKFEEESVLQLYSSDMGEEIKKTIKAYYGMAGGFTSRQAGDSSEHVQREEKSAYDVTDEEWQTLDIIFRQGINVNETVQTGKEFQDYRFWRYIQELPVSPCSLGQLQAETVFADIEKKANSQRRGLDYSQKIAIGCGAAVFASFAVYRCFRR